MEKTLIIILKHSIFLLAVLANASIQAENALSTKHLEKIVIGAGCFWGVEKAYEQIPGVVDVVSGYAGGHGVDASYKAITALANRMNPENHAEVVEVTFNSNEVGLEWLLRFFFELHDPTQSNRQGNDVGTQYRSIIFVRDNDQKAIAQRVLDDYQLLLTRSGYGSVKTIIEDYKSFVEAESYHQDYLAKNPDGYCPDHSTGVKFSKQAASEITNDALLTGLHILVVEAQGYCPYCEKFRSDVTEKYLGSIPISYRTSSQLGGLTITTPTWATPTVIFLRDGREELGFKGYMPPKEFYSALGMVQLGNSDAFKVAFRDGTDPRFCREYEVFKNTPDGTFVDKLSGVPLFDTRDRFNSKTGWLSFTKAIDGAVYRRLDYRFGIKRIEIRSVSSDIHLGHVFPDGPNGMPRYCINASVLDFIPAES